MVRSESLVAVATCFYLHLVVLSIASPIHACKSIAGSDALVVSKEQRNLQARELSTDTASPEFAWPDTPLGMTQVGSQKFFFASNGAKHNSVNGRVVAGSIARTEGTLEMPLGSGLTVWDVGVDFPINSTYPVYSYAYAGAGPVISLESRSGNSYLIAVTHVEIPTPDTHPLASFYSLIGLSVSLDIGKSWRYLGEVIRPNHRYSSRSDGFDIGDPAPVLSSNGQFLSIYFRDWIGQSESRESNVTKISVARASLSDVRSAAENGTELLPNVFHKYFEGRWEQPGLGGLSTDLKPSFPPAEELQVIQANSGHGYVLLAGSHAKFFVSSSVDGLTWDTPTTIKDLAGDHIRTYVNIFQLGSYPVQNAFYRIVYTAYPLTGSGWLGADVRSFDIECVN